MGNIVMKNWTYSLKNNILAVEKHIKNKGFFVLFLFSSKTQHFLNLKQASFE